MDYLMQDSGFLPPPDIAKPSSADFANSVFAAKLVDHLAVAAFVVDVEGHVRLWNKACERLTGMPAEEVIGTRDHWRALYEEQRPCLADLLLQGPGAEGPCLYEVWSDPVVNPRGLSAENWAVMPRVGRRMYLAFDVNPVFDDSNTLVAVIETIRDLTSHKIMQKALEGLAEIDQLTSLPNRRAFDNRLLIEWSRTRRHGEIMSLLMIDVDYFKQYNDTHGHVNGDECLRRVAQSIGASVLRETDLTARIGGEEFAVVLPGANKEGAVVVAERIRANVQATLMSHRASDVSKYVTVSIGVATNEGYREPADLIQAADNALYCAKRLGRNRVEVSAPTAPDPEKLTA